MSNIELNPVPSPLEPMPIELFDSSLNTLRDTTRQDPNVIQKRRDLIRLFVTKNNYTGLSVIDALGIAIIGVASKIEPHTVPEGTQSLDANQAIFTYKTGGKLLKGNSTRYPQACSLEYSATSSNSPDPVETKFHLQTTRRLATASVLLASDTRAQEGQMEPIHPFNADSDIIDIRQFYSIYRKTTENLLALCGDLRRISHRPPESMDSLEY